MDKRELRSNSSNNSNNYRPIRVLFHKELNNIEIKSKSTRSHPHIQSKQVCQSNRYSIIKNESKKVGECVGKWERVCNNKPSVRIILTHRNQIIN